jgi:hypothetical protein
VGHDEIGKPTTVDVLFCGDNEVHDQDNYVMVCRPSTVDQIMTTSAFSFLWTRHNPAVNGYNVVLYRLAHIRRV